jgi:hypothetical protein
VTTHIAPPFATQFANPLSAIPHVLNPKMPFATSNAKNPNAKLNVPIKDVKCLTAQNVLLSANNPIALLTVKHLNQNANQSVKNLNVTGNVINPLAQNPSANLFVKIPIVFPKSNAVPVLLEHLKLLNHSPSSKKLKNKLNVANAKNKLILTNQMIIFIHSHNGIVSF